MGKFSPLFPITSILFKESRQTQSDCRPLLQAAEGDTRESTVSAAEAGKETEKGRQDDLTHLHQAYSV